jgi:hypothetical protein
MVEIFKTNIEDNSIAENLIRDLNSHFPHSKINFDLDDCDKILRIESEIVIPEAVAEIVTCKGFICEVLE